MENAESVFEDVLSKLVTTRIEFISQLALWQQRELLQSVTDSGWSPLQIADHLSQIDCQILEQLKCIQTENNPLIKSIAEPEPADPPLQKANTKPEVTLENVLARMHSQREQIFAYLVNLPDTAWERPVRHPQWGQFTFYHFVCTLPLHDQLHTQQLDILQKG